MRFRTPAELKDDVAVAPKYAGPYEEKSVDEAFPKIERLVTVRVPPVEISVLIVVDATAVTALKISPTAIART